MDAAERAALLDAARRHPRLLAMLDLWLAAAAERLALPIRAPLTLVPDAVSRWRRIDGREERRGNYEGLWDEIAMSLSGPRLRRAVGGNSWLGRQTLRVRALRALLAPSAVSEA
jgi:hypothetical protein